MNYSKNTKQNLKEKNFHLIELSTIFPFLAESGKKETAAHSKDDAMAAADNNKSGDNIYYDIINILIYYGSVIIFFSHDFCHKASDPPPSLMSPFSIHIFFRQYDRVSDVVEKQVQWIFNLQSCARWQQPIW